MPACPYCHAEEGQVCAGRNFSGTQRMKCQRCRRRYTPQPLPERYPESLRNEAVRLYLSGLSFRAVARRLEVHHQSVINWVNEYARQLPRKWRKSISCILLIRQKPGIIDALNHW